MVAFTIAMHHGWRWAAAVVAWAVVMAAEVIARAMVITAEVTITRSGATEIFRAALFGAALAGREVVTLAFGATRGAEVLGRGYAIISTIFHAALWLRAAAAVVVSVPHGRRALAVIWGATEGAVFLAAWGAFAGGALILLTLLTVGIARGLRGGFATLRLRVFAFTLGIGAWIFTRGFAGYFAAWWGLGLACFRGGRWSGSGWFGGFLGAKGGDAEGAEREQHEVVSGFGFHGLEAVEVPWGAAIHGVQRRREGELCGAWNIL